MAKAKIYCSTNRIKTLKAAPNADVQVDDLVVINNLLTIAYANTKQNTVGEFVYAADEVALPKATGSAINAGALLYWDADTSKVTTTVGSNKKIGIALAGAGSDDTEVLAALDSRLGL